jgi:hypothetical protein
MQRADGSIPWHDGQRLSFWSTATKNLLLVSFPGNSKDKAKQMLHFVQHDMTITLNRQHGFPFLIL